MVFPLTQEQLIVGPLHHLKCSVKADLDAQEQETHTVARNFNKLRY